MRGSGSLRARNFSWLLVALTVLPSAGPAAADEKKSLLYLAETPYRSGRDRYEHRMGLDAYINTTGQFIEVPLDHANPAKGKFDLFYRLSRNFDRSKPTMIYFNGGPGGMSDIDDFSGSLKNFNIVYFDQRGTGFSHLRTFADATDPSNFSSESIARDAEYLRWHLAIDRLSIYGQSYGTVPATIYGHLFPEHTRAVVLEGVIFDGTPELWTAPYRLKLIQAYYDGLAPETKAKVQQITDAKKAPEDWFSQLVRRAMYSPDFTAKVDKALEAIFRLDPEAAAIKISQEMNNNFLFQDSTFFGAYMFTHIACQELSNGDPASAWGAVLKDGTFVPGSNPQNREACLEIPGMAERMNRTYRATDYPLQVPVTYFEGTTDGATVPPNAVRHFKQVPQGKSQLIFVLKSGHSPVIGTINHAASEPDNEARAIAEAFEKALSGQLIDSAMLKKLSVKRRWAKGVRFRPVIPRK